MSKSTSPFPIAGSECGITVRGRLIKIAHLDLDKYEAIGDPEQAISEVRRFNRSVDIFTFMQTMADKGKSYGYPAEPDNLAILPISTYEHWWNQQIRSYPRNRARQAEKRGVIFKEVEFGDSLAHGIWEVYNETKVRQGRPNRHYGKDLETVRREAATYLDRSIFIGAYLDDQLIGFVKLVLDSGRLQASLMNIVSMVRHRDKAPTNALIAWAVRACADRGIPYLMYQNYQYGNKGADSLTHFKEINGFQRVDLCRYYVPLTPLGRAAFRLGLHHSLVDHLPESVATRIRLWRTAWYTRKMNTAEGAC